MGRPRKIKQPIPSRSFESCYEEILKLVDARKHRWSLTALNWMDWDDVRQQLLKHIFTKWDLYKQDKKLSSWVTTVVNNQMINMIRNHYGNFKRPCIGCEFYEEDNVCKKFGEVSTKCELYRAWTYGKKTKHDIQLPWSMEHHQNEVFNMQEQQLDIDKAALSIHERMKKILKPLHWFVYYNLFVLHKTEEEVGKMLKFKSREKDRSPGYKQVANLRREVLHKVKEELRSGEIEIS